MKKILMLFMLINSFLLTSCVTDAQVMYEYGYYDYMNPSTTIIYRSSIPYYRIWDVTLNCWTYRLVPRERIPYIRYGHRPLEHYYRVEPHRPQPPRPSIFREIPRTSNHGIPHNRDNTRRNDNHRSNGNSFHGRR